MPAPALYYCRTTALYACTITNAYVTDCDNRLTAARFSPILNASGAIPALPLENLIMSIADMFAAQLAELKRQDEESQRKTAETIARARQLIDDLEAMDRETEL